MKNTIRKSGLLLSGLACVLGGAAFSAVTPPAQAAPAKSAPATLKTIDAAGLKREIAKHRGKAVLVNFWATWCLPCKTEFPALVKIQRDYAKRGVVLLFVSADGPSERAGAQAFLRQNGVRSSFIINGNPNKFISTFDPKIDTFALPRFYLYNRQGRLVKSFSNDKVEMDTSKNYRAFQQLLRPVL